jgi:hypothetical protein
MRVFSCVGTHFRQRACVRACVPPCVRKWVMSSSTGPSTRSLRAQTPGPGGVSGAGQPHPRGVAAVAHERLLRRPLRGLDLPSAAPASHFQRWWSRRGSLPDTSPAAGTWPARLTAYHSAVGVEGDLVSDIPQAAIATAAQASTKLFEDAACPIFQQDLAPILGGWGRGLTTGLAFGAQIRALLNQPPAIPSSSPGGRGLRRASGENQIRARGNRAHSRMPRKTGVKQV